MKTPYIALFLLAACGAPRGTDPGWTTVPDTLQASDSGQAYADTVRTEMVRADSHRVNRTGLNDTAIVAKAQGIDTRNVRPDELLAFAKTLIGTPYVYGSTNPKVGFDCSGFITYVFNHFNIKVPRSSIDFTAVGPTIDTAAARPGDLILFTGTNPQERDVGHMGIVVSRDPSGLQFIHSTSGKIHGVTITPFNDYYKTRFVRVARVFP
ncbi:NlpC/P60 family protein [Flaviaesturariibacter flavus]|uniref:NlpC/P60 family protein n=1 Tax=Flaviaesturariibacter flavus TaxID=2502780 RepID=A0A4R1B568_9BACT|nr:C40 family peptidase [Flaviaesturariibacter flavus]TCJ13274.1 NlpC/P60 family protein [Flaviaesturariibacter flavus]